MKSMLKLAMVAALIAVVFGTAVNAETVRASIPFKFRAGDTVLPPGVYTVQVDQGSRLVTIASVDGTTGAYLNLKTAYVGNAGKGALLFHKYGSSHFLYRVKPNGAGQGFEMPSSKAEREAAALAIEREIAQVEALR